MGRARLVAQLSPVLLLAGCHAPEGPTYTALGSRRSTITTAAAALSYNSAHWGSDRRRLMTRGWFGRGYGTDAWLQPRADAESLTIAQLDTGVVVARILTFGNGAYGKFHLPDSGTVYVWVRSRDSLALFIPADSARAVGRARLHVHRYGPPAWSRPAARWLFNWSDDDAWVTCALSGCCLIDQT